MTKEKLQPKEYQSWNDKLIVELLEIKMSVKELIVELNKCCVEQILVKDSYEKFAKHLLRLRSEGKVNYIQSIERSGRVVDSVWEVNPVANEASNSRLER
jgi:hypothetical protein